LIDPSVLSDKKIFQSIHGKHTRLDFKVPDFIDGFLFLRFYGNKRERSSHSYVNSKIVPPNTLNYSFLRLTDNADTSFNKI